MRRAHAAQSASSPSLFPFLAVLLCTMGALIVILVLIARQARAVATEAKAETAAPAEADPQVEQQREMLQWQIEQMQSSRAATADDLERSRLELSHREEYLRRLREEFERLMAAAEQLRASDQSTAHERQAADARLKQMQQEIAAAAARLEEARRDAKQQQPSYAIIPYEGPNKTHRRPIYIECRADAVVIQPEGIVLGSRDFQSPLGPGNPLAAALRAAREYITTHQPGSVEHEPYPLLLVRPDGIAAYYKAREAIESWGPDFGYELIGADWQLDFPPADPQLAEVERQAVEQGRRYQQRLAIAAPSRYGRRTPVYGATPTHGGFVEIEDGYGASNGDGESEGFGSPGFGGDGSRFGSGGARPDGGPLGEGNSPHDALAQHGTGPALGSPAGTGGNGGQHGGQPGEASGGGTGDNGYAGSPGAGGPIGAGRPQLGSGGGNSGGGSSQNAGGSGSTTAGESSGSAPQFHMPAQKRGKNWALPNRGRDAVPVSRPVRAICRADQVIVLLDPQQQKTKIVPMPGATADSLDALVSALWRHMDTWGIAGAGMYWRPILVLQPAPGGEQRAEDLRRLLDGSGIVVEQDTEGRP